MFIPPGRINVNMLELSNIDVNQNVIAVECHKHVTSYLVIANIFFTRTKVLLNLAPTSCHLTVHSYQLTQHFLNSLMMDSGEMSFQALLVYFSSSASYTISTYQAMHHLPYLLPRQCIIFHIYFSSNALYTLSVSQAMHYIPYLLSKHCFIYLIYLPNNASYTISS